MTCMVTENGVRKSTTDVLPDRVASIVFDVAAVDMVDQCPALKKRIKPIMSVKRLVYPADKPVSIEYFLLGILSSTA